MDEKMQRSRIAQKKFQQSTKGKAVRKAYRATPNGKARQKADYAKWAAKNRAHVTKYQHERRRLWLYGITIREFEDRKNRQGQLCAICGLCPKRWCVDHDHAAGFVRGLLCLTCNAALGGFKDSIENLHWAILYLEKHAAKSKVLHS